MERQLWGLGVLVCAATGCLTSGSVVCADGRVCPPQTRCYSVSDPDQILCVDPDAITQCDGKTAHAHCGADGRCYDGVCLPIGCGNGRVDVADPSDPLDDGEICDDGNQTSGDGCSSN